MTSKAAQTPAGGERKTREVKISVAMATYNGALYLRDQLDSFVAQMRRPDELVVTDDGSTDNTLNVLRGFQRSAPFQVKICRNSTRLGCHKNFEKALLLCSGDVIFVSDQDDVWFPNKLERVLSQFVASPQFMVIINDQILTDEKLAHHNVTRLQRVRSSGQGDSDFLPGSCTALRREWRDLLLPIPSEEIPYDVWINRLADQMGLRLLLAEPLQFFRRHASNTSSRGWSLTLPRKPSLFDRLRTRGLKDSRSSWAREIGEKEFLYKWIEDREVLFRSLQLEGAKERTCMRLELEIQTLRRRLELMKVPRGLRAPAVVKILMEGGYEHFSGWKSALNDVLR